MFLVERTPGREVLYHSHEEFASAIRRGEVTVESRIFHRTTSTWIPITLHPTYRQMARITNHDGEPAKTPFPPMPRKEWTFLPFSPDEKPGEAANHAPVASEAQGSTSVPGQPVVSEKRRWNLRFWK
jgi:hypothetical protein